jgi:hypothetical protein
VTLLVSSQAACMPSPALLTVMQMAFLAGRYNIMMTEMYTVAELRQQIYIHWANGVRVSRVVDMYR